MQKAIEEYIQSPPKHTEITGMNLQVKAANV